MHPEFKDKEFDLEFPGKLLERFTIGNLSDPQSYYFDDGKTRWYHPSSVPEMLDLMNANPSAKIVNGNTEVGIETRFKSLVYPVLIYPRDVVELKSLEITSRWCYFWRCNYNCSIPIYFIGICW